MTNEETAGLLGVTISEVEALGIELDVPTDTWTVSDVFEADRILDEQSDEEEDEDECEEDGDDDDDQGDDDNED